MTLLTTKQAGQRLNISADSVRCKVKSGQIQAVDINHGTDLRSIYRIPESEIDRIVSRTVA